MSPRMVLAVVVLLLCAVIPTQAQVTVTLGGPDNNNGFFETYPNSHGGNTTVSMSPYSGTIDNGTTSVHAVFYCLDFSTPVGNGQSWNGQITLLANSSDYTNTLQYTLTGNNATSEHNYLEMAWLITQEQAALSVGNTIAAAHDDWAIWSFTDATAAPAIGLNPDPYGTNASLLAQAQAAISTGFTVSNWQIITPTGTMPGQEFLVPTPEQPSVVLFLLGIMLFVVAAAFRKTQQRTA